MPNVLLCVPLWVSLTFHGEVLEVVHRASLPLWLDHSVASGHLEEGTSDLGTRTMRGEPPQAPEPDAKATRTFISMLPPLSLCMAISQRSQN